jgi:hypothetical protein
LEDVDLFSGCDYQDNGRPLSWIGRGLADLGVGDVACRGKVVANKIR